MRFSMRKAGCICLALGFLLPLTVTQAAGRPLTTLEAAKQSVGHSDSDMQKVCLSWKAIPGAVKYKLVLLRSEKDDAEDIVFTKTQIYANGYELDTSVFGAEKTKYYWKVCGLNYDGREISAYTTPQPVTAAAINTDAPKTTTEFEKMDYAPLYPTYSWIPYSGADNYEIKVWKKGAFSGASPRLIRDLYGTGSTYYDDAGYTAAGEYYWQVRALDAAGNAMSRWSAEAPFQVVRPVTVAALGDSITHGGGAISTGPGLLLYDWETYSAVPIKNMGYSGNTVESMNDRFERDVLPFAPKILVIMGGVNNYRVGDSAWKIIHTLAVIRDKCYNYGIIPVFATVTPLNPYDIARVNFIAAPPDDWQTQQQRLNAWILQQPYSIDVSSALTDYRGWLKDGYTTDGLHPDYFGKKYIGETISRYLQATFPDITGPLVKERAAVKSAAAQ